MSEPQETNAPGRPWHLWVVGILGTLWGGLGVLDYIMTVTKNEAYLSSFTEEQLDHFYSYPSWAFVLWAIGVFGGTIGALLLLMKKKLAVEVLLVSLVPSIIVGIYSYTFTDALELLGVFGLVMTVVALGLAVLMVLYACSMRKKGVLS